jgi:hypothetical protein
MLRGLDVPEPESEDKVKRLDGVSSQEHGAWVLKYQIAPNGNNQAHPLAGRAA